MKEISLRRFTDQDVTLLTSRLNKEYKWLHHCIVMRERIPSGFCQQYDCYDACGLEDWYTANEPADTYSIDYLIGNEDYLNKGCGKSIVSTFTEKSGQMNQQKTQFSLIEEIFLLIMFSNRDIFDTKNLIFCPKSHR